MNSKSDFDKFNIFINVWIVIFTVLFIGFSIYFSLNKNENVAIVESQVDEEETVRFKLNGKKTMTIYVDDNYEELGFTAESNLEGDVSSYVEVEGGVDTSIPGTYKITYTLIYRGISPELVRTITVKEKGDKEEADSSDISNASGSESEVVDSNSNMTIYLSGYSSIYMFKGREYKDAGARAVNSTGEDVSNRIKTSGGVDTNKTGTYTLNYSITDSKNRSVSVERKVSVVDMQATIRPSVTYYTKEDVSLTISIEADMFSHIVLPSGESVSYNTYTYPVSSNGTYSFEVYNTVGLGKRYSYKIKNIDKEAPTGSCTITHNENGSVITISASDNVGIKNYVYNDKKYSTNKLSFSKHLTEGANISVGFNDKANNYGSTSCVVPKIPEEYLVDDDNKVTAPSTQKVQVKYIDATDLGCKVTVGGYTNVAKKIAFNTAIADKTHNILKNVCTYVNQTPWMTALQHDGAFVNREIKQHDYHSQGLAIDLNDLWYYTDSSGYKHNPYGGQGTWTWTKYKKFICDVCDGKEDCKYNINYIIFKRYFEGNGWCWGGNWGPSHFDPMHFEVRAGRCSIGNKPKITC